ncbi:MAG: hypothetical protein AAB019_08325, partial [Planctomycetota bacterium]
RDKKEKTDILQELQAINNPGGGYYIDVYSEADSLYALARPEIYGITGRKIFVADGSGVICQKDFGVRDFGIIEWAELKKIISETK